MNKKIFFTCIMLANILLFFSCKKDDNNTNSNISDGNWRVTLFTDSGNDETSDFSGYTFTFGNDGILTATKSNTSKTGTWSRSSNDFNINLGEKSDDNKPLGELTDDWDVISVSSTEIKLKDDNDSSEEFLTFKKN
ncbi:MAG: hypothetical protein IT249_14425 [Chitinophagaceae bacterium]|nr:hypothetical protein [Chitinophagaceae bacterium]